MRVFKFGGASVKDAEAVKNLVSVLKETGHENTILVVSAMGKTTNAMEAIVNAYFDDKEQIKSNIQESIDYHNSILINLFDNEQHPIFEKVKALFDEVLGFLAWNKSPKYNFVYDQVVGYGELISTTIISAYLNEIGIENNWLDVRDFIKTDNSYRDVSVNWEKTQQKVSAGIDQKKLNITQGFLGSDDNNFTTTLGREGSDYSAAILAYCLNANSVTIWKDVPGVLNADPRYFKETQLLNNISYREAIELAFYGASVIHPKTLQPLQQKEIPLHVKSFMNPKNPGTTVGKGVGIEPEVPCFIVKKDQVLMKLSSLDFSFIVEDSISELFKLFHEYKMKVDLIQNSAISFSVCVDNRFGRLNELLPLLKGRFKVVHYEGVSLYTIRHFTDKAIDSLQNGRQVLLEQRGTETVQLVVK
ncbi:aspartate kinase [Aurantibacter crassamenti]|uniref:aspartate kinase n=1 Tax=Aurantibacter crassamenti TaxID=1837375 RepID=UPI00193A9DCB|nr:aspartate kinase [Aurantibacter crassamenti]MBM1105563.1 aspartate kinase [Aurantibacter crassamenti]